MIAMQKKSLPFDFLFLTKYIHPGAKINVTEALNNNYFNNKQQILD